MRIVHLLSGFLLLLGLSACGGGSSVEQPAEPGRAPRITGASIPNDHNGLESVNADVSWSGGVKPYTVSWDFGGGADAGPVNSYSEHDDGGSQSQSITLTLTRGGWYQYNVRVQDSLGHLGAVAGYYYYGRGPNTAPVIAIESSSGNKVTLRADDYENDDVRITCQPAAQLAPLLYEQTVAGGHGSVSFEFFGKNFIEAASGTVVFDGNDDWDSSNEVSAEVNTPAHQLGADSLYAIPLQTSAAPGEPVTIMVVSSTLAHPFQYLSNIELTAPVGMQYLPHSFHPGGLAGSWEDPRGIWTGMTALSGFPTDHDDLHQTVDLGNGRCSIRFILLPLGGNDLIGASGELFVFQATFAEGVNRLEFEPHGNFSGCYYSDHTPESYGWGNIDNDSPSFPNTVTVE